MSFATGPLNYLSAVDSRQRKPAVVRYEYRPNFCARSADELARKSIAAMEAKGFALPEILTAVLARLAEVCRQRGMGEQRLMGMLDGAFQSSGIHFASSEDYWCAPTPRGPADELVLKSIGDMRENGFTVPEILKAFTLRLASLAKGSQVPAEALARAVGGVVTSAGRVCEPGTDSEITKQVHHKKAA